MADSPLLNTKVLTRLKKCSRLSLNKGKAALVGGVGSLASLREEALLVNDTLWKR